MTDEKWANTVGKIKDAFKVLEEGSEPLPLQGNGMLEWIAFAGPLGKMKLERTAHPRVVGKNVTHSKRIGSTAAVEYVYDATDIVQYVKAYKWNEGASAWEEFRDAGIV